MRINFKLAKNPSPKISFVFFIFEADKISDQPLFKFLNKTESDYIKNISASIKIKYKDIKVFALPGENRKIIAIGLPKEKNFSGEKAMFAMRMAVWAAKKEKIAEFAFWVCPVGSEEKTREFYESISLNAVTANFEFIKYKSGKNEHVFVREIQAICANPDKNIAEGFKRGMTIGEEINACRELANTPGGDMTPQILANHAKNDSRGTKIKTTIFDEKKIKSLGMGGIIGVSKGSAEKPRFIIMEYWGGQKNEKPVVLVGKGVTFDTGGLNLKPDQAIYEMHMDMSGGSAVIHSIRTAARLGLKKNIVAIVPAVENMPSGSSYHPGDVLKTISGKTIEVLNTDAEGRIILADALSYAKKYNPKLVVDVATLTGAAIVALGQRYTGLFTPDKKLEELFRKLGEESGDKVWPLPLSEDYEDEIKGTFGDWANVGKTRYGGATTAAVFLWQFTKDSNGQLYPWVHLDIAPRMTAIEGEYLSKGAAGAPVRLLVKLLEKF
ncbi:leucyl aminopeptidase [Candidatus Giovannonibacteria bacterium]|nr:leucyl aminopeptidase [Candidatus Giovannonibacteria bacterium]